MKGAQSTMKGRFNPKNSCHVCGEEHTLWQLARHLPKWHGIKLADVASHYHEPRYCQCGKLAKLLSSVKGFDAWCSGCESIRRSASAKESKRRLKSDEAAWNTFRQRTSVAVEKQWKEDQTERRTNISIGKQRSIQALSPEQRKQKFGWMNNPDIARETKREIWGRSLGKWWSNATTEQQSVVFNKRRESNLKNLAQDGKLYDANLPDDHPSNVWIIRSKSPWSTADLNSLFGIDNGK